MLQNVKEGYGRLQGALKSMSLIIKNESKINYNYRNRDDIQDRVIHRFSPFSFYCPQKDNNSKYPGKYIKCQKIHFIGASLFDNIIAVLKKVMVVATPIEKVSHGILLTAPGINAPTTSEPNRIFAPSRKNSDITLLESLSIIAAKVYYGGIFLSRGVKK